MNPQIHSISISARLAFVLATFLTLVPATQAAVITWTEQGTITNEEVIQPNVSAAFDLRNTNASLAVTTTTQTVTFVSSSDANNTVSGGLTLTRVSGFSNNGIAGAAAIWNGTPTDTDFGTVMDSFAHSGGANPATGTFTLNGLTEGVTYSLQLFASDTRATIGDRRTIQFSDGLGNSTAQVAQIDKQYFIGTFTAVGTSQTIGAVSLPISPGTSGSVILNAVTVSVIPEPSSLMLLALGGLGLISVRRR